MLNATTIFYLEDWSFLAMFSLFKELLLFMLLVVISSGAHASIIQVRADFQWLDSVNLLPTKHCTYHSTRPEAKITKT